MLLTSRVVFFLIISIVREVASLPSNICKDSIKIKKVMCERVFVWNEERHHFVSLTNEVLESFRLEEYKTIKQKTIKVLVSQMMPYVYYNTLSRQMEGYLGDIWNILAEQLEFNYDVTPVQYDTGLRMVSSGKADVLLAAVVYKKDLINVYYSHPYFYNWYHLYMKSPKQKPTSSYFTILDSKLMLFSLLVFFLLTTSVLLSSWFLNSTYKVERRLSVPACFLGIISGYLNQGFDLRLRSYSCRLQVFIALVFGLMLYSAMNAVLVAKITAFEAPYPFASLQDVAASRTHSMCLRNGSFVYNNFTDEKGRVLPEWRRVLNNERCVDINDPENISKIICKDDVIVLENKVIMSSMSKIGKFSCPVNAYGEKYFKSGNSFLMSRAFREKRVIDKYVAYMRSTGVIQRLEEKWINDNAQTKDVKVQTLQVTIEHTKNVFVFYAFAIFVSLCVLGLEILHNKYTN